MKCACGHELPWHNPCSKCRCPYFIRPDASPADAKAWKAARRAAGRG